MATAAKLCALVDEGPPRRSLSVPARIRPRRSAVDCKQAPAPQVGRKVLQRVVVYRIDVVRMAQWPHGWAIPGCIRRSHALFSPTLDAYIGECRREPAMAINGRRNKPIGPGGSTRRLHQRGRNRIDEGVKGVLLPGMVPPLSGRIHSCQRQLCSGCPGRVMRFGIPI